MSQRMQGAIYGAVAVACLLWAALQLADPMAAALADTSPLSDLFTTGTAPRR